ncbi:INO80 complex subunit D-like isoform X1 [Periplaneta americana]|uniref:INO80 complex subunit D-like isoform X1 n=1 Tax=Periplaneta americana TaxID=6978 RepID=UPI0037E8D8C0
MMLQNETEMYNLGLAGNARYCNGHVQVAPGMAAKKECKSKKGKMVPNKDDLPSPTSPSMDGRLKFSDRLKALLNSGTSSTGSVTTAGVASVKEESVDQPDDPYAFSEPEPQVLRLYQNPNPNHTYSRRCVALSSKTRQASASPKSGTVSGIKVVSSPTASGNDGNTGKLYPALSASLGQLFPSNSPSLDASTSPQLQQPKNIVVSGENKVSDDESSKTMNRLQAKIARNKVIGKHRKVRTSSQSPDLSPKATPLAATTKTSSSSRSLWPPQRERSLLEEQLLGLKPEVLVKKEAPSPTSLASRHGITYRPQMVNHSSQAVMASIPSKRRRSKVISRRNEVPRHEALQRIHLVQQTLRDYRQDLYPLGVEVSDSEESDGEESAVYQRHWFSAWLETDLACVDGQREREGRLGQMRAELRRRLNQTWRGMPLPSLGPPGKSPYSNALVEALLDSARRQPSQSALFLRSSQQGRGCHSQMRHNRSKVTMLVKRVCSYRKGEADACSSVALPCTQHCVRHIMYNVDQLLFEHCTAKFSDNTQCCVPVFDICHELPLCLEHARKRDNYDRMCAETKPKKVRKKAKPSAMTRPSKRGKKKRRVQRPPEPPPSGTTAAPLDVLADQEEPCEMSVGPSSPAESVEPYPKEEVAERLITDQDMQQDSVKDEHQSMDHHQQQQVEVEVEEEVLAMAEELPLDTAELANHASRLLEEHDLTNVLNQIPADAFNDLFTEDKNGEYEPTREETEELERALEAVDKDVKSLEKLSQTQGLLVDTLMDEHALVQTLAQLPADVPSVVPTVPGIVPVFATYHHHNGYVVNMPHAAAGMAPITHPMLEAQGISIQTQTDMPS